MNRTSKTIIKYMKQNPIVLNDIISEFVGFETTRYCNLCKEITNLDDWLVKCHRHVISGMIIKETLHCPTCYSVCCNSRCDDKIQLNDDLREVICCKYEEGRPLCINCFTDEANMFYCDSCNESYCAVDDCCNEYYRECADCDNKYCEECSCYDHIYYCNDCGESSCCRRFAKIEIIEDIELICENCINVSWITPS